jgi:GMP synthase-like glutamine amidotransferase
VSAPRPRRLWIVDPSMRTAETEGVREVLGDWPGEHRLFQPALVPGDGPRPGDGYDTDAVVVMGSAASVYDELDWLGPLARWLEPIVDGSTAVPLLGICFGHQLIAHVAGAAIGFLDVDRRKRVGIEWATLEGGRLVAGSHRIPVVVSHREEVKERPQDFAVVARRDGVAIDGLEHRDRSIFSFQFHPEARGEFAGRAGIHPERIDARLLQENRRLLAAFRRVAGGQERGRT